MPELGRAALVVTLGLALYALVAGAAAARTRRRRLAVSAQNALLAAFGSTAVAAVVLFTAFARDDFSFVTVMESSSRDLPIGYALSAFWGGQAGSLLLWLLLLTAYGAAAILLNRRRARDLVVWVVPVLAAVAVFFSLLLVAVASPFQSQPAPADGFGLNPSLQNPYMMAHPPFLYLGYVGLTVPFAFAMGALLAGRSGERWIVATRRWTLFAWAWLGIGQLLGALWAYEELGWGGYWAWDPVENAALMPWLAATAFLHSVMIQEKRGMLKVWNVLLVILSFGLSLFGTFLTRSGILNSIHSFTESSIGPWFLGFIVLVVAFSLALVFFRLPLLRARTKLESLVSREATFLYNNLLLVALTLTILWAVAWPILSVAVRGQSVFVGPLLQLLPARLRAAAAPADGDRPARGLAPGFAARPAADLRVAGRVGARRRRAPARSRRRLVRTGARRVHVLGVRARLDRTRVRTGHARPARARRRIVAARLLRSRRAQPPPLRRLRRPRRDRAARDRDRRLERV